MQPENIQFKIKVKKRWSRHKNRTVVRKEKNRTTSLIYSWPSDPFLSPTYDSSSKLSRKLKLKTNSPGTLKLKTTKFPRMLKMKISTATSRSSYLPDDDVLLLCAAWRRGCAEEAAFARDSCTWPANWAAAPL